jgi:hypothetical protein
MSRSNCCKMLARSSPGKYRLTATCVLPQRECLKKTIMRKLYRLAKRLNGVGNPPPGEDAASRRDSALLTERLSDSTNIVKFYEIVVVLKAFVAFFSTNISLRRRSLAFLRRKIFSFACRVPACGKRLSASNLPPCGV